MTDTTFYLHLDETIQSTRMLIRRSGLSPKEFFTDKSRIFNLHCLWQQMYHTHQTSGTTSSQKENINEKTQNILRELQEALSSALQQQHTNGTESTSAHICQLLNELTHLVNEQTTNQLRLVA